jgi:hypothetical protein
MDTPARAHGLGLAPFVHPTGDRGKAGLGDAKLHGDGLSISWCAGPLLACVPLSRSCRTPCPVAPGGGRRARGWLGLGPPGPPCLWCAFLGGHPRLLSHEILPVISYKRAAGYCQYYDLHSRAGPAPRSMASGNYALHRRSASASAVFPPISWARGASRSRCFRKS